MSTQPLSSSVLTALSPSPSSSTGSSTGIQITGLASGLDTNAIINELIALDQQPITTLTNEQAELQALNGQLTSIQTALQGVALNAQALGDPTLFASSQTVTSSNPQLISATTATGAGVGGYQVAVSQLANSAQRTFTFTSPAAADTITIDGHQTQIAAGATIQDFVTAINSDANATVYAASTNANTVVLSSRTTGDTGTNFIQVSDPGAALSEQTSLAKQGQNANYTVDGIAGTSTSNTVTGAIAGVSLTLNGVTSSTVPVTVTVAAPAPSASSIEAAVNTFVQSYNSIIDQISTQVTTAPPAGQPSQYSLFGDDELTNLLSDMRQAMYAPGSGLPTGMASLSDIGINTGAAIGGGVVSQSAVSGKLSVNATTLANAIQTNPTGVQQVLQSWAQSFSAIVNNEAAPGAAIDTRIQGDNSEVSDMGNQIDNLNAILADKKTALTAQFAALESTLSQSQAQGSWLAGQISSLPVG